ncbi:MAG: UbiA family prenyltransferase, partial [Planctomycetes bacterium]|nr:UbiA family prenyltransferase [Planctomycetota bacterium]
MRRLLLRLAPVLHLTRVSSAFAAVANVWLVILWTRVHDAEHGPMEVEQGRLWLLLAGGTVAALGLFAFGASLNDILDQRRDRAMHPNRPLASGQVTKDTALFLVAGS